MYYCNNCDIAHEEKNCPLCAAKEEIKQLEETINHLDTIEYNDD